MAAKSAADGPRRVRWADLVRAPHGDPGISEDIDVAEPASVVALEGCTLRERSSRSHVGAPASGAEAVALAARSGTTALPAALRSTRGRPLKVDSGAGILAMLDYPRSPLSKKWEDMDKKMADFAFGDGADERVRPALPGTDWEEMEADLAEALQQASGARAVPAPPPTTAGLRATNEATAALATWPPSPRGFSLGPNAAGGSEWCAHEVDRGWLYKPAERIYFHLPSETLWRVDPGSGAPMPPGHLARASCLAFSEGLVRVCFEVWGGLVAASVSAAAAAAPAVAAGVCASDAGGGCPSSRPGEVRGWDEEALVGSAEDALEALVDLSTGSADSCFRVVRQLRRLRGALPGGGAVVSTERFSAVLRPRLQVKAALDRLALERLSSAMVDEARFQRLRGALSFGAELWACGGSSRSGGSSRGSGRGDPEAARDGEASPSDEALGTLAALDALARALPGGASKDLATTRYNSAGEIPSALRIALRQLGPI